MSPITMHLVFNPLNLDEVSAAQGLLATISGVGGDTVTITGDTSQKLPALTAIAQLTELNNATSDLVLDADGVPHDPRIHSGTPTINQGDGKWKKIKGGTATEHARVTAELKAMVAASATSQFADKRVAPAPAPRGGLPAAPKRPGAVVAPPKPQPEIAPTDFVSLAQWVGRRLEPTGALPEAEVIGICKHYELVDPQTGEGQLQQLSEPDNAYLVGYVYQYLADWLEEDYLPGHTKLD